MPIYNPGKISEHIYFLGNIAFPSYLIKGEKNVLVDSGVSITGPSLIIDVERTLGDKGKLNILLLTHSHYDHCGSAPYLKREIPGLQIGASDIAHQVFSNPKAMALMRSLNEDLEQKSGARKLFPTTNISFSNIEIDLVLKDGSQIDLGEGVTLFALSTPGHTRCSFSYYIRPDRAIFVGETGGALDTEGQIMPQFLSGYKPYIESLKKLARYDVEIIGLAHGGMLVGEEAHGHFLRVIEASNKFKDRIARYLRKFGNEEKVVEAIAQEDYSRGTIFQDKRPYMLNLSAMVRAVKEGR